MIIIIIVTFKYIEDTIILKAKRIQFEFVTIPPL